MFVISLSILFLVIIAATARGQYVGDSCIRKYDNSPGTCKNVRDCPRAREEHKHGVPVTICAYLSGSAVICCPETPALQNQLWDQPQEQKRISGTKCEEYAELTTEKIFVNPLSLGVTSEHSITISKCDAATPLIVGGERTSPGEFPHMAAIGWQGFDGTLEFKCGGSLISDRFVLTAAHCSRSDGASPSMVRLGDQNIRSRDDGLIEVDIQIAEFIKHENYRRSSYYDDIGLIRLARKVGFTKYIRPACLWQSTNINKTTTKATGWGYTEAAGQTSDELMKVELDIINNNLCNSFFEDGKLDRGIENSQICAGVLAGSKDTCNGDSGGPIHVTTPSSLCVYHIIGITSFGSPFCGQKNSPGVYTRVSAYLDWIEERVWR